MSETVAVSGGDVIRTVAITSRIIIDQRTVTAPATTGVTLASLYGGTLPAGAVAARIQADGGTIRVGLTATMVTPATGLRIDDGGSEPIDSSLANVTVVGKTIAVPMNVVLYDRN